MYNLQYDEHCNSFTATTLHLTLALVCSFGKSINVFRFICHHGHLHDAWFTIDLSAVLENVDPK